MTVHLHKESNKIKITEEYDREIDTISPKLFTAALESIFRRLTWETRDLKIDREYLSHLRFADDILVCANTPHELQQMLQELVDKSENQGLKTNKSKAKVMMENDTPINVESCIYLRQQLETKTKTRRFKVEPRPDGQHSPSTATSSRVTLEHA